MNEQIIPPQREL